MRTNVFCGEAVADQKVDEYKNTLQEYQGYGVRGKISELRLLNIKVMKFGC